MLSDIKMVGAAMLSSKLPSKEDMRALHRIKTALAELGKLPNSKSMPCSHNGSKFVNSQGTPTCSKCGGEWE